MNAKKFELELQKAIHLKSVTPKWVSDLYKNDKVSFLQHVPVTELLRRNYTTLIGECSDTDLIPMVNVLYQDKEIRQTIKDNYLLLIQKCKTLGEFKELLRMNYLNNKRYFNDNLEIILGNIPNEYIFTLLTGNGLDKKLIKKRTNFFKEKNQDIINQFLIENKKEYIEFLFFPNKQKSNTIIKNFGNETTEKIEYTKTEKVDVNPKENKETELENLTDLVLDLIEEILNHENLEYKDIKHIGGGAYSEVIKIGSKIIKIGKKRRSYNIPYDKTILQPIIRIDLSKISNLETTIEVMENVDTSIFISKEDLYEFYVSLRERGIVFADIKSQNLGVLLKENKIHWNKNISLDNENRGIQNTLEEETLKPGDIVILDTDYLYKEEDYQKLVEHEKFCWGSPEALEFEDQYQRSKHNKGKKGI